MARRASCTLSPVSAIVDSLLGVAVSKLLLPGHAPYFRKAVCPIQRLALPIPGWTHDTSVA
jgi:hypothetical protein